MQMALVGEGRFLALARLCGTISLNFFFTARAYCGPMDSIPNQTRRVTVIWNFLGAARELLLVFGHTGCSRIKGLSQGTGLA